MCNSSSQVCWRFLFVTISIFYVLGYKGWILCSFRGDYFLNGGIVRCL